MRYNVLCLLVVASFTFAQDEPAVLTGVPDDLSILPKPIIKYLHYDTDIQNRYATTVVSSNVANPASKPQEVSFGLILPETAFISGFVMIIKNKEYNAYVKEKEEAKKVYDEAVAAGQSAAHIQQDVRDSNRFQVSVNVEAEGKVLFKLTYEELLSRTLGVYKNVININPGQIVKDLVVKVNVKEPVPITQFAVPKFRTKNEISADDNEADRIAVIDYDTKDNPFEANVTWSPDVGQQVAIAKDGVQGQLVVEYDVSRMKSSQILLDEGYFVHFFTPNESTPALPKHAVFVLDISGSMSGRKIEQLREAMLKILSDLIEKDYFSIILFSSNIIVWSPSKTAHLFPQREIRWSSYDNSDTEIDNIIKRRDTDSEILQATSGNIEEAKKFVKKIYETDATNIMGGLRDGIDLINKGQTKFSTESNKADVPQPVIIFLTDGQPNVDISDPNEIVEKTVELNTINTAIFSLAFGEGADLQFLRRLSLKNNGFARNIYEASDAALQLNNFYKEISSPLLADVNFSYLPGQVQNGSLTKHWFPIVFRGSEIVVAGKLADGNADADQLSYDFSAAKNSDASIDYKDPHRMVIFPHPFPPILPSENKTFGHLEKLWGYMTIKQLLDKDTSNKDNTNSKSPEKEEALRLALKYSFVTPLTSLVVVKPNSSDSAVEPEKASSSQFGYPSASAIGGAAGFGLYSAAFPGPASSFGTHSHKVAFSSGGLMLVNRISLGSHASKSWSLGPTSSISLRPKSSRKRFKTNHRRKYSSPQLYQQHQLPRTNLKSVFETKLQSGLSTIQLSTEILKNSAPGMALLPIASYPSPPNYQPASGQLGGALYLSTETLKVDSNIDATDAVKLSTTIPPRVTPLVISGNETLVPVENVTWLANYVVNHDNYTIEVPSHGRFIVGFNETDTPYGDCQVPNEFNGHCRHLQYCSLSTFVNSVDEYSKYFCPISNGFAGVCCPSIFGP